jgi:hypothetical protein
MPILQVHYGIFNTSVTLLNSWDVTLSWIPRIPNIPKRHGFWETTLRPMLLNLWTNFDNFWTPLCTLFKFCLVFWYNSKHMDVVLLLRNKHLIPTLYHDIKCCMIHTESHIVSLFPYDSNNMSHMVWVIQLDSYSNYKWTSLLMVDRLA